MKDYIVAHNFAVNNYEDLKKNQKCGCFYCTRIFDSAEINDWIIERNMQKTAVCPYCEIDSVIGESSGYPITKDFMEKMKEYWF